MKTKILLTALAVLAAMTSLTAQTDVQRGSTQTFTTSLSNSPTGGNSVTYNWSAAPVLGTTITNGTTATASILFNGAALSTGNVSVYAISASAGACTGNTISRSFRIVTTLSLNATLPALSAICPNTTSNATGGDLPAFTINFIDASSVATPVTSYTYQILDPSLAIIATNTVNFASSTSNSLNLATAYTNAQAGTYTIRITAISNGVTNVAYPDAANHYPNTTFVVETAPELNPF